MRQNEALYLSLFIAVLVLMWGWIFVNGRRLWREHRRFLEETGLRPVPELQGSVEQALARCAVRWPGLDRALSVRERWIRVSECYGASTGDGPPIYFLSARSGRVSRTPLSKKSSSHLVGFFALESCFPGTSAPFAILVELIEGAPRWLRRLGRAADRLALGAVGGGLALGLHDEVRLVRHAGLQGHEHLQFFAEPDTDLLARLRPELLELLALAPQHGIRKIVHRDGWIFFNTIYATSSNAQRGRNFLPGTKIFAFTRRFADATRATHEAEPASAAPRPPGRRRERGGAR